MGRAPCCAKVGLNRGPWTPREDTVLSHYIQAHGEGNWRSLPKKAGLLRCGKSCRLRWVNYLRPDIKRGNITPEEDDLIIRLHSLLGNRWSLIAGRLPGRTDNEIKNYWNTHLRKGRGTHRIDRNSKRVTESAPHNSEQKLHVPKPIRVRRNYSFEGITNENDSNDIKESNTTRDYHENCDDVDRNGVGFILDSSVEDDCDRDHHDLEGQENYSDSSALEIIYREYLAQLLNTEGDDHDQVQVDSFVESLLI